MRVPDDNGNNPAIPFVRVDFPEPLEPVMNIISPAFAVNDTPSTAVISPYFITASVIRSLSVIHCLADVVIVVRHNLKERYISIGNHMPRPERENLCARLSADFSCDC